MYITDNRLILLVLGFISLPRPCVSTYNFSIITLNLSQNILPIFTDRGLQNPHNHIAILSIYIYIST